MIRFGPSGNSDSFYNQGYQSSIEMPGWLYSLGLNAYEYQCGKGIKISESTAIQLGEQAALYNIELSVHAPYYINMCTIDSVKHKNSINYILESLKIAKWMRATRVVVHPGSCSDIKRNEALSIAIQSLQETINLADSMGYSNIAICPEVLGKINQFGTVDEILELCLIDTRLIPTIDFGHVHARGLGALNTEEDFEKVIDSIENKLGKTRAKHIHCHFSKIEFTKGGEKKHRQFKDTEFGPDFWLLAKVLHRRSMEPTIICESNGTMAEDALQMKNIYYSLP